MARRTKREIMSGVDCVESRIVDHNTVEYERENGERVIRLHLTNIVTYKPGGKVVLNTGGWKPVTTKDRINKQLYTLANPWQVWSEKNEMYLSCGGWMDGSDRVVYHWHDGITIDGNTCDGEVYDKERVKQTNAWQRRVKRYAKKFAELLRNGEIPAPGAGDCWCCMMVDQKGRAMGESGHDDHVHSHVIEKYYVPSLVVRATEQFGASQVANNCLAVMWGDHGEEGEKYLDSHMAGIGWEQIGKAISRYCIQWAPYNEATIKRLEEEAA